MVSPVLPYPNQCLGKRRYFNKETADWMAGEICKKRGVVSLGAYKCIVCSFWHLGHKKGMSKKGMRKKDKKMGDQANRYQKERDKLLGMLKDKPVPVAMIPVMYRRHIRPLEKAGIIAYNYKADRWEVKNGLPPVQEVR